MPAGSPEKTNARKEEIINACEKLYRTMSFKEITMKEIGNEITFTRTGIYHYFQTKEEIFLALLTREYDWWAAALNKAVAQHSAMDGGEIADLIAGTLNERRQLLKILAMNHYDLEENSRRERLVDFKKSYKAALEAVEAILVKYRIDMDAAKRQEFIYSFFPFMFGIYPYTVITEKQQAAMEEAGVTYERRSIYELTYSAVKRLLDDEKPV